MTTMQVTSANTVYSFSDNSQMSVANIKNVLCPDVQNLIVEILKKDKDVNTLYNLALTSRDFSKKITATFLIPRICLSHFSQNILVEVFNRAPKFTPLKAAVETTHFLCEKKQPPLLKFLLKDEQVNLSLKRLEAVEYALETENFENVEIIFNHSTPLNKYEIVCFTIKKGHGELAKKLIDSTNFNSDYINRIFNSICEHGPVSLFNLFIQRGIDPSCNDNEPIFHASQGGQVEIVKLLLKDKRVDPSARGNDAIKYACEKLHANVVELLLTDERVDPSIYRNMLLARAVAADQPAIVKALLKDKRVDPSVNQNACVKQAKKFNRNEIVELLTQNERYDKYADSNKVVQIGAAVLKKFR